MIGKKYAVEIWCLGIHWWDRWKNCCVGVSCVRVLKCSAISVSKSPPAPLATTNLAWCTRTPSAPSVICTLQSVCVHVRRTWGVHVVSSTRVQSHAFTFPSHVARWVPHLLGPHCIIAVRLRRGRLGLRVVLAVHAHQHVLARAYVAAELFQSIRSGVQPRKWTAVRVDAAALEQPTHQSVSRFRRVTGLGQKGRQRLRSDVGGVVIGGWWCRRSSGGSSGSSGEHRLPIDRLVGSSMVIDTALGQTSTPSRPTRGMTHSQPTYSKSAVCL